MSAQLAERLVWVLLFEHPLHESLRFDQCRNDFSTKLYSTVLPDALRETSGEVRTTARGARRKMKCVMAFRNTPRAS